MPVTSVTPAADALAAPPSALALGQLAALDDAMERILPGVQERRWLPVLRAALDSWRASVATGDATQRGAARAVWASAWHALPPLVRADPEVEALALVVAALERTGFGAGS
jgi:hypothetical protein